MMNCPLRTPQAQPTVVPSLWEGSTYHAGSVAITATAALSFAHTRVDRLVPRADPSPESMVVGHVAAHLHGPPEDVHAVRNIPPSPATRLLLRQCMGRSAPSAVHPERE